MFYNIIFQQSTKISEQNLHMAKNCCNFATANEKRTPLTESDGDAPEAKRTMTFCHRTSSVFKA